MQSSADSKNIAKHSKELSLEELIRAIASNLKPTGTFGILLPFERSVYFEELAMKSDFFLKEKLLVKQTPSHNYFRTIMHFSKNIELVTSAYELIIKNEEDNYTEDFKELLKDYYFNL